MAEILNNLENNNLPLQNNKSIKPKIYCQNCNKCIRKMIQDVQICVLCIKLLKKELKLKEKEEKIIQKEKNMKYKNLLLCKEQ